MDIFLLLWALIYSSAEFSWILSLFKIFIFCSSWVFCSDLFVSFFFFFEE